MRKKWLCTATAAGMLFLAACGSSGVNISEQMEQGEKCLQESNYEQAAEAFSKIVQVDSENVEANRKLAQTYQKLDNTEQAAQAMLNVLLSGKGEAEDVDEFCSFLNQLPASDRSVLAQIAYAGTGEEKILPILFAVKGEAKDYEGIRRLAQDVDQISSMKLSYLEPTIQKFYTDKDYDAIRKLSDTLERKGMKIGVELVADWLETYDEDGMGGIQELLDEKSEEFRNWRIGNDGQLYIGERDAEGKRSGFGICFYGTEEKPNSRIYVGNWENDVRSGEGQAFSQLFHWIKCQWKNDYPEGEVEISKRGIIRGSLAQGHVAGVMTIYTQSGEVDAVHCIPDEASPTGYSYQEFNGVQKTGCDYVEKHVMCWDCAESE